jgi:glutamate-1-semialdehyde 2,1-aminomutase
MAAGLAGLTKVLTPEACRRMNAFGDDLRNGMNSRLFAHEVAGVVIGVGSVMNIHFVSGPISTPKQLEGQDHRLFELFQLEMMLLGQYVTGRGMLALSLPIGRKEIDGFLSAFDEFLQSHKSVLPHIKSREAAV